MDKTGETQGPKKREFFKVNNPKAELKRLFEEVEGMSIQEIKKRIPDQLIRNIYASLLVLERELSIKQGKRQEKAADFFIKLNMNPNFWKNLKHLEEMAAEFPKKEKEVKVEWNKEGDGEEGKKHSKVLNEVAESVESLSARVKRGKHKKDIILTDIK